jgi:hypothetical protein
MIDRAALLATLKPEVSRLEEDILARVLETPVLAGHLEQEHQRAVNAGRTAMALEQWREGEITQAAVAWVLACVFVRFLEDNGLIDRPLIAGPGNRRAAALGHREEHFRAHPHHSDREYLEGCFRAVAEFPAVASLFDERHNPLWRLGPSADGARELRALFAAIDPDSGELVHDFTDSELGTHVFETEDSADLRRILGRGYHAVVGNPPYIAVQDSALRDAYRDRYRSCHGGYALTVPFMERFFELARALDTSGEVRAGFVGKITGNSFMKREFGTKLVEEFLPFVDVQTLIDASGVHVPGHGTPTILLFGRGRQPVAATIRVIDGIRGEPRQPPDPSRGLVWIAIENLIDRSGEADRFVRSSDVSRTLLSRHPMTLGVGRDARRYLETVSARRLDENAAVGFVVLTGDDDFYVADSVRTFRRFGVSRVVELVEGTSVRDWTMASKAVLRPHDDAWQPRLDAGSGEWRRAWPFRTGLAQRRRFGIPMVVAGRTWFEWRELYVDKLRTPLTIAWGEVSTHNHFVLDRGRKVFKQTAPVIKLPAQATTEQHIALLGGTKQFARASG